jgi:hypothetical protein
LGNGEQPRKSDSGLWAAEKGNGRREIAVHAQEFLSSSPSRIPMCPQDFIKYIDALLIAPVSNQDLPQAGVLQMTARDYLAISL